MSQLRRFVKKKKAQKAKKKKPGAKAVETEEAASSGGEAMQAASTANIKVCLALGLVLVVACKNIAAVLVQTGLCWCRQECYTARRHIPCV